MEPADRKAFTACERTEDGTRLGSERNGDGVVQVFLRATRTKTFSLVAWLGSTESFAADA
jgi:hypothetical protein